MRHAPWIAPMVCLIGLCSGLVWAAEDESPQPQQKAEAAQVEPSKSDRAEAATPKAKKSAQTKGKAGRRTTPDAARDKASQPKTEDAKATDSAETKRPKPKEPAAVKKATVVRMTIKGDYPEGPVPPGLFTHLQPSLAAVIQRMDQAAEDPAVAAVLLRIEHLDLGRGKLNELRAAVARLRKAGKPVYAELTSAETSQYLLASACDEIFMPPSGMLLMPGVRAEMMFFKGLLDKLGIEFDLLQQGKYKGASEPLTRSSMSAPLRESLEAVVGDEYDDLAATIAKDRKTEDYRVKTLLDQGIFTAAAARKAGLIDHVTYADQFEDTLRKRLKVDQLKVVTDYKKKQVETDFSGITGLMKLMELMFGGKPTEPVSQQRKLAVVYAVGPIMEGKSAGDFFGEQIVGSTSLVSALRTAADDPKVVAVVLRIDSPGGSAVASDLIWREVVRTKKPIVASMSDVAGSGGYYIAMGAAKIVAEPGTITGSIGVIGGKPVLRGLFGKLGITTEVISRGKNSGSFSLTEPFTPAEREAWKALMEETYRQFVSKAAEGRKMSRKDLEKLAQGRIYTGRMAAANGLVDRVGTLQDAIAEAKKAAGLKPDEKVDLLILPKPKSLLEQLFGEPSLSADLETVLPGLGKTMRQAALVRELFAEPALMLMPCRVQLK